MPLFRKAPRYSKRNTQVLERPDYGWIWKPLVTLAVIYLLVVLALGIWWSRTPDAFDVKEAAAIRLGLEEPMAPLASVPETKGAFGVATLMTSIDTLLEKPGGYLRNDVMPPGLWLDNMSSWELGVLRQTRSMTRLLADKAGGETASLEEAVERLGAGDKEWFYPSTERHLAKAREALNYYFGSLTTNGGESLAPSDELLTGWLNQAAERLDGLSHRLSASISEREALRDLDIDPRELPEHNPWYRVDNVFFETRGATWTLLVQLRALAADYSQLVQQADAQADVKRLMAELELTQRRLWSPLILNGTGFGIFANHSLMMANYTLKARDLAQELARKVASASEKGAAEKEAAEGASDKPSQTATDQQRLSPQEIRQEAPTPSPASSQEDEASKAAETDERPSETSESSRSTPEKNNETSVEGTNLEEPGTETED